MLTYSSTARTRIRNAENDSPPLLVIGRPPRVSEGPAAGESQDRDAVAGKVGDGDSIVTKPRAPGQPQPWSW